jgi:cbb3-type cytochrome oxidase cytochrome c subunit
LVTESGLNYVKADHETESLMKNQSVLHRGLVIIAGLSLAMAAGINTQAESESKGNQVYADKKCALCHMIQGKGGKTGGDLSTVGTKRDAEWLKRFIMAPKAVVPNAKMPPFKGSADELDALVAYLMSLK